MNKDVIYIEPEDDITDILANIKSAKNKIVALVPPKKAGVLRSAVNFKLIAKTARQNSKAIVLITSDESLLKLASAVKMPVAKTLQSKPQIPEGFSMKTLSDAPSDVIEAEKPAKKAPEAQKAEAAKAKVEANESQEEGEDIDAEVRPAFKTAKDAPKKEKEIEYAMTNNFAFGGNNASVIFAKHEKDIKPLENNRVFVTGMGLVSTLGNSVESYIEGTKNGKPGIKILPPLFSHNEDGEYTDEIKKY